MIEVWNSKSPGAGPIDVQMILGEKLFRTDVEAYNITTVCVFPFSLSSSPIEFNILCGRSYV